LLNRLFEWAGYFAALRIELSFEPLPLHRHIEPSNSGIEPDVITIQPIQINNVC